MRVPWVWKMKDTKTVDILLSTHNGEAYLEPLLNSIINQTYHHWRLIIRDDGSQDNTREILRAFKEKYPDKIILIVEEIRNIGVVPSYSMLLDLSTSDYVMLCDQDDVWLPQKIEHSVNAISRVESEKAGPVMVFTDLIVADKNLNIISDSFFEYRRLNRNHTELQRLLVQNVVTGCTVIMNRQLAKMVVPIPEEAIMHDWWIALVASLRNGVYFDCNKNILYRQHAQNTIGAQKVSLGYVVDRIMKMRRLIKEIELISDQAQALLGRYHASMDDKQRGVVEFISTLHYRNRLDRIQKCLQYRVKKSNVARTLFFLVLLLMLKVKKMVR